MHSECEGSSLAQEHMRVLGEWSWARPSTIAAGYDACVLGLHATYVRVCTRALVCRGQGKGWVRNLKWGGARDKKGGLESFRRLVEAVVMRVGTCTSAANRTSWMSKRFNQ